MSPLLMTASTKSLASTSTSADLSVNSNAKSPLLSPNVVCEDEEETDVSVWLVAITMADVDAMVVKVFTLSSNMAAIVNKCMCNLPAPSQEENMTFFQKQLHGRRTKGPGRVGHAQKKILAMMEEETVINDVNASSVGHLDLKEKEVCDSQEATVCRSTSSMNILPCD